MNDLDKLYVLKTLERMEDILSTLPITSNVELSKELIGLIIKNDIGRLINDIKEVLDRTN